MTLAHAPGVIDAIVHGDSVHVVTATEGFPPALASLPEMADSAATPVPPRFEDVFVDMLSRQAASVGHASVIPKDTPAHDGAPVIQVADLVRRFGDFLAVDGISFDVRRGEIFGLLGANGAGKSTTFRMLCGLLPASSGHLEVAGHDLRHSAATAREHIGYMSQKFSQYANLSVRQNLDFFASAYGLANPERKQRIAWAEDEFDLGRYHDHLAGDLPLGYKQRLAMACALMHDPDILFLDEPTSGVDPLARREFWQRINTLALAGVTVLVTTHFMEEAEYCDRLVIMAAGRILSLGEPAAIKAAARSPDQPHPSMEDAFIKLVEDAA